jgi:hypothetical protein
MKIYPKRDVGVGGTTSPPNPPWGITSPLGEPWVPPYPPPKPLPAFRFLLEVSKHSGI